MLVVHGDGYRGGLWRTRILGVACILIATYLHKNGRVTTQKYYFGVLKRLVCMESSSRLFTAKLYLSIDPCSLYVESRKSS